MAPRQIIVALGIGRTTHYGWMALGKNPESGRYRAYREAYFRGRALLQEDMLNAIVKTALPGGRDGWKAAAWLLGQKFPEEFGKKPESSAKSKLDLNDPDKQAQLRAEMLAALKGAP